MQLLFLWFFLFLSCFSCRKKETKGEQEIGINFCYTPFTVDPRKGTDPATAQLCYMLYEGLTRLEADGSISLALARDVQLSEDKKEYRFTLRRAMWSDGTPLTAYHFEESWKKVLDPDFPSKTAHFLFVIKNGEQAKKGECSLSEVGVKAIDEETLIVQLKQPTPYFLELISYCTYFPVPNHGDEVPHPTQSFEIVSNGPFKLISWKTSNEILVVKNPFYWDADYVKLNTIRVLVVEDEATTLKLFEQGKLDFVGGLTSPVPIDALETLKNQGHIQENPIAGTTFSTFNIGRFPFNNLHIRKAFAYAINRKKIIDNVTQMFDEVATGPVPNILKESAQTFFQDNDKYLAKYHFDKGLQDLGLTRETFPQLTYEYFSSELQKNLAISLQSYWRKVLGIEVKLRARELKSHISMLKLGDFDIAQMSWIGQYNDRMNFLERFETKKSNRNYGGWENPRFTEMLVESHCCPSHKRAILLEEAEALLMSEMPIIPLYHFHAVYLKNTRLKDLAITPIGEVCFHRAYIASSN